MATTSYKRPFGRFIARGLGTTFVLYGLGLCGAAAQTLPANPKPSCTVPSAMFSSWFQTGAVTLDGIVEPANSVAFSDQPNCPFYQWSEQMFLWMTSPAPPTYGSGDHIFDSPTFFDVSPPDANGQRTFLPHVPNVIRPVAIRNLQKGPGKLQILFDKQGQLVQVKPPVPGGPPPRVLDSTGKLVEITHVERAPTGVLILQDATKARIQPRPMLQTRDLARRLPPNHVLPTLTVQKFIVDNIPIFIDPAGNIVDVEQGQAGGDAVLQAQNGSLVYYTTSVNDVYAYFLTGVKDHAITPGTQFPTTMGELNAITSFAAAHNKTFPDPAALAIEIKTSWVEAAGLPNIATYLTTRATVPTYDTSNPALWTVKGEKTVLLAMVGVHVVGSTAGHPEMIWATFEHQANSPRGAYSYINSNGGITNVPEESGGPWLFAATNPPAPFNVEHMNEIFPALSIQAAQGFSISPSNTIHWKAWGAASDLSPNPIDGSPAASNSEIIAINNSVRGMLLNGDVRKSYIMTGATWTIGGANPNDTNQVGTSLLANSTMETYHQGTSTLAANSLNCFTCHSTGGTVATTDLSHVFGDLKPLF